MALGHLAQGLHRHKAHGDVEGVEGLRGSGTGVGLGLGLAQPHPGPGVPGVGVLPLLGVRGLVHVQNPLLIGNLLPQLPQVHRQQGLKEHQRPAAVGQGVEHLHGDAVAVVEKPDELVLVLKIHRLTGVLNVRLQKRPGGIVRLEVVPEYPLADFHMEAGEPGHGAVDGPLEGLGVHLLGHDGGEAVHRRIGAALDGRVHHGGVIQLKPALVLSSPPNHTPPPFRLFYYNTPF